MFNCKKKYKSSTTSFFEGLFHASWSL